MMNPQEMDSWIDDLCTKYKVKLNKVKLSPSAEETIPPGVMMVVIVKVLREIHRELYWANLKS